MKSAHRKKWNVTFLLFSFSLFCFFYSPLKSLGVVVEREVRWEPLTEAKFINFGLRLPWPVGVCELLNRLLFHPRLSRFSVFFFLAALSVELADFIRKIKPARRSAYPVPANGLIFYGYLWLTAWGRFGNLRLIGWDVGGGREELGLATVPFMDKLCIYNNTMILLESRTMPITEFLA